MSTAVQPAPLTPITPRERSNIRYAAYRAKKLYPGPVGELVAGELTAWEDFGYRLGNGGTRGDLLHRLLEHILTPMDRSI